MFSIPNRFIDIFRIITLFVPIALIDMEEKSYLGNMSYFCTNCFNRIISLIWGRESLIFHVFYRCGRGRVGRIKNYHPRQYVTVITKHDTLCLNQNSIVKESVGYGINLKWSLLVNAKYVQINCQNLAYLSLLTNAMLCHNLCYYPITFLYSAGLSLLGNWLN